MDNETRIICEQGDMGLFDDKLSDEDQKKYDQQNKEDEQKKEDKE